MPIEDADDRANFVDPDEFGVVVLYNGVEINCLPLTAPVLIEVGGPPAEGKTRRLLLQADDVPAPADGDTAVIGAVTWKVVLPIDDPENGMIAVTLEATS